MKPNELRIGNKVYYNGTHKEESTVTSVTEYLDGSCLVNLNGRANGLYKIEELSPIPITEAVLLKCGFEKIGDNYSLLEWRFHINKPANYDGYLLCEGYLVITDLVNYLHQLQNIYLALTGEELEIKTLKNE